VNKFNFFSPVDFRYSVEELKEFLSEDAFTKYKLKVEVALIKSLAKYGLCPQNIVEEVKKAAKKISTQQVYE